MSIFSQIETQLKQALLARDLETSDILKLVKSDILLQAKADNLSSPTDEICLTVVRKHIKHLKESAQMYSQSQDDRLVQVEIDIKTLNQFLPDQLDDQAVSKAVSQFLDQTDLDLDFKNFKTFLQQLEDKLQGQASRQQLAGILQNLLKS